MIDRIRLAVIGPEQSGKSSFIRLLYRLKNGFDMDDDSQSLIIDVVSHLFDPYCDYFNQDSNQLQQNKNNLKEIMIELIEVPNADSGKSVVTPRTWFQNVDGVIITFDQTKQKQILKVWQIYEEVLYNYNSQSTMSSYNYNKKDQQLNNNNNSLSRQNSDYSIGQLQKSKSSQGLLSRHHSIAQKLGDETAVTIGLTKGQEQSIPCIIVQTHCDINVSFDARSQSVLDEFLKSTGSTSVQVSSHVPNYNISNFNSNYSSTLQSIDNFLNKVIKAKFYSYKI